MPKKSNPKNNLPPAYNPKETEEKIYQTWEKSGFFNPDKLPKPRKKSFCITMAPPNVTGSLHMGHALEYTISDVLIRQKRMAGFLTLWLPGTDHAGIATQNAVEKTLRKENISRHDLGKEKFIKKIWEWKEQYGNIITNQLKKLGVSADWTRSRFTMDQEYTEAVRAAFLHYHKKGWIYEGERTINWCTRCRTSLSDLEIEHREEHGKFYYIKYGPLTLGTARPETKLGDTALAVNPKDKRYKQLVGKEISIQSVDSSVPRENPPKLKEIKIKVVGDEAADPNFGTGVIKVTPAHDLTDFEIYQRHPEIPIVKVIGENGRMNENAGVRYEGLNVVEARKQIVHDMEQLGLMEKIEDYTHNLALCYRCGSVIEPLLSKQWFLKMGALAQKAAEAVLKGKTKFHPKKWEKVYLNWLKNIKDWTISRQIWWGHKIPLEGVDDVLDTWFSSALWPFATLGWPKKTKDLQKFYPTDVITNDRGIINLWDTRMIFSGLEFMNKEPFKTVLVHATILTKEGQRMSKSLGTGIDPINLINSYGTDATRFGIVWQAMGGQDIRWSEEHVNAGRKFANKIWNAARFVLIQLPLDLKPSGKPKPKTAADKKILKELAEVTKKVTQKIEGCEFGPALHDIYDFFWHSFCDKYIESAKIQMVDKTKSADTEKILFYILAESLKLIHPFMPFVTEEIWKHLPSNNKKLLLVEKWPK
ncbi:MAG: valine--tRNA ligase [bacterium]|nr:valine--tRNA ligase [bacterium]